jgi:hypothetical protein
MTNPNSAQGTFGAPDDHAIVVGIDHYRPGFRSLQGCINDATLFRQWLVSPTGGGLDPANVECHVSAAPANPANPAAWQPVRDSIHLALVRFQNRFSQTGQQVGRRLYLFYAGHGVAIPQRPGDAGLVFANSELPKPLYAFPGRQVIEAMQRDRTFAELVVFMDCCREVVGDAAEVLTMDYEEDPTRLQEAKHCCGLATTWNGVTAERLLPHPLDPTAPDLVQGVFTHALLNALSSAALGIVVNSATLEGLVEARVDVLNPHAEHPLFFRSETLPPIDFSISAGAGSSALAAAATNAKVDVTVAMANTAHGFQVVAGDLQIVLQRAAPVQSSQVIQLPPGLYEFRPVGVPPLAAPVLCKVVDSSSGGMTLVQL